MIFIIMIIMKLIYIIKKSLLDNDIKIKKIILDVLCYIFNYLFIY